MLKYDFFTWLDRCRNKGTSLVIPNFSDIQFEVLRVKWNRSRQRVPYTIYNGPIFDWVESMFLTQPPFEKQVDTFCLEFSNVIGSPVLLHHLLEAGSIPNNDSPTLRTVPPFGLGFLLACESFRGELKPSHLLDVLFGDIVYGQSGEKGTENAPVKYLYRDWLHWKRQQRDRDIDTKVTMVPSHDDIESLQIQQSTTAEPVETVIRKRLRVEPSSGPVLSDDDLDVNSISEPLTKRQRKEPPSLPPAHARSGLLQWLSSTTTRFKPSNSVSTSRHKENVEVISLILFQRS
ncbi:hypothetical protein J3R30DRAFT_1600842 [Lentinula aciculospora]|uniref:Uncharacterized protein n=1 Tax=Lentinula aciculospora TaxID=153920 RepID=A0A9W8ZWF8_9AGAR|nr:hypothetical protein J3R30DRAFT_1600842 [Lentinula aciculospora]